jgi:hypothetical protein
MGKLWAENDTMPTQSTLLQRRAELLKTVGAAIFVLGLLSASAIFWAGESRPARDLVAKADVAKGSWSDGTLPLEDLKGSSRTTEMNFGKVAVLLSSWLHQWENLKPHQLLALSLVTITTLAALSCLLLAKRLLHRSGTN